MKADTTQTGACCEPEERGPTCAWGGRLPLAAALLVSLLFAVYHFALSPSLSRDGVVFLRFARRLDTAMSAEARPALRVLDAVRFEDQHPLFPLLITIVHRTVSPPLCRHDAPECWEMSGRLVAAAGHMFLLIATYLVGRRLFDPWAAGVAACVLAVLPEFIYTGFDVQSDSPGLALLMFSVLFAIRSLQGNGLGDTLACGMFGGLAYLVRPEYLQAVLLLGLWRLIQFAAGRGLPRRDALISMLVLAHSAGVYVVPLMALRGGLVTKTKHERVISEVNPAILPWTHRRDEIPPDRIPDRPSASEPAPAPGQAPSLPSSSPSPSPSLRPADAVPDMTEAPVPPQPPSEDERQPPGRRLFKALREFLGKCGQVLRFVFVPAVLIGLWATRRSLLRRPDRAFVLGLAGVQFTYLVFFLYCKYDYIAARHLMPTGVLASLWVAVGTGALASVLCRAQVRAAGAARQTPAAATRLCRLRSPQAWLTLLLFLGPASFCAWRSTVVLNTAKTGFRLAGTWLTDRIPAGTSVVDPMGIAAFYAGADERNLIQTTVDVPLSDGLLHNMVTGAQINRRPIAYMVFSDHRMEQKYRVNGLPGKIAGVRLTEVADFPLHGNPDDAERVRVWAVSPPLPFPAANPAPHAPGR